MDRTQVGMHLVRPLLEAAHHPGIEALQVGQALLRQHHHVGRIGEAAAAEAVEDDTDAAAVEAETVETETADAVVEEAEAGQENAQAVLDEATEAIDKQAEEAEEAQDALETELESKQAASGDEA